MNKILKRKSKPLPTFKVANKYYCIDKEKSELLAEHFESIHRLDASHTQAQQDITDQVHTCIQENTPLDSKELSLILATPKEILSIIKTPLPITKPLGKMVS